MEAFCVKRTTKRNIQRLLSHDLFSTIDGLLLWLAIACNVSQHCCSVVEAVEEPLEACSLQIHKTKEGAKRPQMLMAHDSGSHNKQVVETAIGGQQEVGGGAAGGTRDRKCRRLAVGSSLGGEQSTFAISRPSSYFFFSRLQSRFELS
jgi:hypothetical protein